MQADTGRRCRRWALLAATAALLSAPRSESVLVIDAGATLADVDVSGLPRRPLGTFFQLTRLLPTQGMYRALIPEARDPRVFAWPDPLPAPGDPRAPARALWHSQVGQDKLVAETAGFHPGGVFIDLGASDGITLSNTYVLERDFRWSGLCLEADPTTAAVLRLNRPGCVVVEGAVTTAALAGQKLPFLSAVARDAIVYLDEEQGGRGPVGAYSSSTSGNNKTSSSSSFIPTTGMLSGLAHRVSDSHFARIVGESAPPGTAEGSYVVLPHLKMVDVPTLSLAAILQAHGLKTLDFLSIDIEGGEADALESVIPALHTGELVINTIALEQNDPAQTQAADSLRGTGLYRETQLAHDILFIREPLLWSWDKKTVTSVPA